MIRSSLDHQPGTPGADAAIVRILVRLFKAARATGPLSPLTHTTIDRLQALLGLDEDPDSLVSVAVEGGAAFVDGRMVDATGEEEEIALDELEEALVTLGGNTIILHRSATLRDIGTLVTALTYPDSDVGLPSTACVRKTDPARFRGLGPKSDPVDRVIRAVGDALDAVGLYQLSAARGDLQKVPELREVTDRLIGLAGETPRLMTGLLVMPGAPDSAAWTAVSAGMLCALVAEAAQMPAEERYLAVFACLSTGLGEGRAAVRCGGTLTGAGATSEAAIRRLPGDAAFEFLRGSVGRGTELRECAAVYETAWMQHGDKLGLPHGGRLAPSIAVVFAATSIKVTSALAVAQNTRELVASLAAGSPSRVEIAAIRLCLAVLGLTGTGTTIPGSPWDVAAEEDLPAVPDAFRRDTTVSASAVRQTAALKGVAKTSRYAAVPEGEDHESMARTLPFPAPVDTADDD